MRGELYLDTMKNFDWSFTTQITKHLSLKYFGVMTRKTIRVKTMSLNISSMFFLTEAKGVNLSEEWIGIARFQILRPRLLEGYKWVNGRPTQIEKSTRTNSMWLELGQCYPRNKKSMHLQNGQKKRPNCKQQAVTGESTRCRPMTRLTSRWLPMLFWSLNRGIAPAMPCKEKDNSRGKFQAGATMRNSQIQKTKEHAGRWSENIWNTLP